jgi:hypothetical protein
VTEFLFSGLTVSLKPLDVLSPVGLGAWWDVEERTRVKFLYLITVILNLLLEFDSYLNLGSS